MPRYYLLLLTILLSSGMHAQIDPAKLDSLSRSINENAKAMRAWQDSFNQQQESLYRRQVVQDMSRQTDNLRAYLNEKKAREKKQEKMLYLRLAVLALMLVAIVVRLARRQKKAAS